MLLHPEQYGKDSYFSKTRTACLVSARLQLAVLAFHALPAVNSIYGDWRRHGRL